MHLLFAWHQSCLKIHDCFKTFKGRTRAITKVWLMVVLIGNKKDSRHCIVLPLNPSWVSPQFWRWGDSRTSHVSKEISFFVAPMSSKAARGACLMRCGRYTSEGEWDEPVALFMVSKWGLVVVRTSLLLYTSPMLKLKHDIIRLSNWVHCICCG